MRTIVNKNEKIIGFSLNESEYKEYEDNNIGLCFTCGAEKDSCEPDAREYLCERCNKQTVFGVPEILIMGRIRFLED